MALLSQEYDYILWIMLIALVFDFMDGFLANLLNASSDMGKELDSLADMVSFGFFPGFLLYYLILLTLNVDVENLYFDWRAMPGFLFTIFAALRLAKFNIDERKSPDFYGLPTPAATLLVIGIFLLFENETDIFYPFVDNTIVLYVITIVISFLMISNVIMLSLKTKGRKFNQLIPQMIFLSISMAMMFLFRSSSWAGIILLYIIMSIVAVKFKFAK